MALPEFDERGDLPKGRHEAAMTEVLMRFGTGGHARQAATATLRRIHQLAAATGNERLRQALRSLRRTVQRYEVAYMSDPALVRRSVREHEAIAAALARGAGAHAARLLHAHWQDSIGRLLDLLGRTQRVRP